MHLKIYISPLVFNCVHVQVVRPDYLHVNKAICALHSVVQFLKIKGQSLSLWHGTDIRVNMCVHISRTDKPLSVHLALGSKEYCAEKKDGIAVRAHDPEVAKTLSYLSVDGLGIKLSLNKVPFWVESVETLYLGPLCVFKKVTVEYSTTIDSSTKEIEQP